MLERQLLTMWYRMCTAVWQVMTKGIDDMDDMDFDLVLKSPQQWSMNER